MSPIISAAGPSNIEKSVKSMKSAVYPESRHEDIMRVVASKKLFKKLKGIELYIKPTPGVI